MDAIILVAVAAEAAAEADEAVHSPPADSIDLGNAADKSRATHIASNQQYGGIARKSWCGFNNWCEE